jgi:hypothetical protein
MTTTQSGSNAAVSMDVDLVSKAARQTQYSPDGSVATLSENSQPSTIAGIAAFGANDRSLLPLRVDRLGSLASAVHTPIVVESFEGTTLNQLRWTLTAATMASTQSTEAGRLFNSGAITTVNTGVMIQSSRRVLKTQRAPVQAKFRARLLPQNNSVTEIGFFDAATANGANTSGAYWQVLASGAVQPVVTYNGTDQSSGAIDIRSLLDFSRYYTFDVFMDDDEAVFVVQDTSTGLLISKQSIKLPVSGSRLLSATQMSVAARLYTTGTAPVAAPQLIVTDIYALTLDADFNKPISSLMSSLDRSAAANPFTGAQLQQWANSLEPGNAALSNTVASYATLGGKFQFAAPAGALTDFVLFGYQVPVPANFVMTGIDIESWNTGAASATTPTLLTWAVAVGSNAVNLASGFPPRVSLGAQSFPVGAAIGAKAERISKVFSTPLSCGAGRWVQIILRVPIGSATGSQVIAGMVNIDGYFE